MTLILVVDDDRAIRRALTLNLAVRGFETVEATSGEAALTAVAAEHPELVLLDVGLPGIDGLTVLEGLRGWTEVPVIVLTARGDERSKVRALDAGADDYVTKPFGMGELVARINAVLRRRRGVATPAAIDTAHFRVDIAGHRVVAGEDEVRLTPTEFSIVAHLCTQAGRLVTYRQMAAHLWGPTVEADSGLLRVHMANIRRKLEPDPSRPRYFITDAGVGFRFDHGG